MEGVFYLSSSSKSIRLLVCKVFQNNFIINIGRHRYAAVETVEIQLVLLK